MNSPAPFRSHALALLPNNGQPDLLFVLLHGQGANAAQMRPLAQALQAQYPQAAVLSIDGPTPDARLPGGGAGFQWYDSGDGADEAQQVAAALPDFIATVRAWADKFELSWDRVALAGFSQGAILALEAVQAEAQLAGRVLAFGSRYARLPIGRRRTYACTFSTAWPTRCCPMRLWSRLPRPCCNWVPMSPPTSAPASAMSCMPS